MVVAGLAIPVAATAQSPPAVNQYQSPFNPGAVGGGGSGGGGGGQDGQGVAGQGAGGGGDGTGAIGAAGDAGVVQPGGSGGSLPFTGYPLTTLIWIVLALLAAGLCIRLGSALAQRLRTLGPPA